MIAVKKYPQSFSLALCSSAVLFLAGCGDSAARKADERAFDALGVYPIPAPAEIERQRAMIESANRCLGLLEFAERGTDENILAALKERGITRITSNEIQPLLSKAKVIERDSSLPDAEIEALATRSRSLSGVSLETRKVVKEITDCVELSQMEARKSAR